MSDTSGMGHRSYSCQVNPTAKQRVLLSSLLAHLCELYNAALGERRDAWKVCGKKITCYDQYVELTKLRALDSDSASFPVCIQRDPLRRVQRAFDGFFRRVRSRENPGYPRFRSASRYNSLSVDSQNFKIEGNSVIVCKIGGLKFRTRFQIKGKPHTLHLLRYGNKWRARIVCKIGQPAEKVAVASAIGIDVGLTNLVTLSDGHGIDNPRWTNGAAQHLALASRNMARKKKGSRNREKARAILHNVHVGIRGRRRAYLHSVSSWLVSNYDLIAYEKLDIRGMVPGRMAKSIMDAAWGELIWQITYKAESAGKWAVPVKARGTTQTCSSCGVIVPKKLWQRVHNCPTCGLVLGRDHNAALNVLQRGLRCAGLSAGVQV